MLEFEHFIKANKGEMYNKFQQQVNIQCIPMEYEAMFFNNFFETKKQELEDYYEFEGFEIQSKKKLIDILVGSNRIKQLGKSSTLQTRVFEFCMTMKPNIQAKKFWCTITGEKINFFYDSEAKQKIFLFSIFIYELLKEEMLYVY